MTITCTGRRYKLPAYTGTTTRRITTTPLTTTRIYDQYFIKKISIHEQLNLRPKSH